MKEIGELSLPEDVKYSDDHEWAKADGDKVRIGITDYAQDQLGDIVFVEMPEVGAELGKGDVFGTLESVKAVAEMFIPVSGEVVSVNGSLEESPALVNEDPYGNGWIVELKPSDPSEMGVLMTREAYLEMLKGMQK